MLASKICWQAVVWFTSFSASFSVGAQGVGEEVVEQHRQAPANGPLQYLTSFNTKHAANPAEGRLLHANKRLFMKLQVRTQIPRSGDLGLADG